MLNRVWRSYTKALCSFGLVVALAGCGSSEDLACIPPPIVDCANYKIDPSFWRSSPTNPERAYSEDDAAAAILGLETCVDLVGRPLSEVRRAIGARPDPLSTMEGGSMEDGLRTWSTPVHGVSLDVYFAPNGTRNVRALRVHRTGSDYPDRSVEQYCGQEVLSGQP